MKKYKYIFWDLDGTITNSFEGVIKCIAYALEPYGITLDEKMNLRKYIGPPLRVSLPEYAGLPHEDVEDAIIRYRERYIPIGVYECELFPNVKETMEVFRQAGLIQVLTSSKPEEQCKQVLEHFQMVDHLDEIVGASHDGRIDSKLEVLNEAFRRLQMLDKDFSREQVVLIGDTRFDAAGAAEAGIDCIGISYGFGTPEELFEHGAIAVYDDLITLSKDLIK